jgi:aldehyde dehydrogenase (NAD+)
MQQRYEHFIGGSSTAPTGGRYFDSIDPARNEKAAEIARGDARDVDAAVRAAKVAFAEWSDARPIVRGRILFEIARRLRAEVDALARLETLENGKPMGQSRADVETAAQYFEFYAGLVNLFKGETIDLGGGYHSYTRHEPFGVVAVITPWNAPINQAGRGIAPALAVGNTVVAKPSEFTSTTTLELARIALESGIPKGVLNVVTGTGPEAGAALVSHPDVRKVAFTGSVRAGREIGKLAAERIIPLTLELGGKSPDIIFADADLKAAIPGALRAMCANTGQVCSLGSRILVEDPIHETVVAGLKEGLAKIHLGPGTENVSMGPITTAAQYQKVQDYYRIAREEDASVEIGGDLPSDPKLRGGFFVAPTLYTNVRPEMRIAREEIFGPVGVVIRFKDEEEAIRIANDVDYGLVAGIWTSDLSRAHRVAARLEAGQVFVNEYFAGGVETPFGGYKMSGYGREKGIEALHHYTQLKCVTIKL